MLKKIEDVKSNLQNEIKSVTTLKDADQLKIKYLGRKGIISDLMRIIPTIPLDNAPRLDSKLTL